VRFFRYLPFFVIPLAGLTCPVSPGTRSSSHDSAATVGLGQTEGFYRTDNYLLSAAVSMIIVCC
jgi:hypothetical protein